MFSEPNYHLWFWYSGEKWIPNSKHLYIWKSSLQIYEFWKFCILVILQIFKNILMKNFIEICSLGWKTWREQSLIYLFTVLEGKEHLFLPQLRWSWPTWATERGLQRPDLGHGHWARNHTQWGSSEKPWTLNGDELLLSMVGVPSPNTDLAPCSHTDLLSSSLAQGPWQKIWSDLTCD